MSTAEWGILLGLVGTVTGTGGLLWRIFEWVMAGRARLKVIGSAGQASYSVGGVLWMARGERFGEPHVIVDVFNRARRSVTVTQAEFVNYTSRQWLVVIPAIPQQLPVRLEPGEKVTVYGDSEAFLREAKASDGWTAYCKDGEDKTHRGKVDEHFWRLTKRLDEEVK